MRKDFRIKFLEPIEGKAKVLCIGDKKLTQDKYIMLDILDLSAGGLRIQSKLDLPDDTKIFMEIAFEVEEELFEFSGHIIWKERAHHTFQYGLQFVGITELERERLVATLNQYQVQKSKTASHNSASNINRRKNLQPLIKYINTLAQPIYLVTEEYDIIDFNRAAENIGCEYDEKCYSAIFKQKKPCPFCKLNLATHSSDPIKKDVEIEEDKHSLSWFYLGQGVFLNSIND